jgi:Monooxygenase af470-like
MSKVDRRTVDPSGFPDLVVIYLGMRVNTVVGLKTLAGFGPKISQSVDAHPDGLLLHENFIFSLFPPHLGMRQYWQSFEALEAWARSEPHRDWWQKFVRNSGGTGSGTKRTLCVEVWRPSMTTWSGKPGFSALPPQ